MAPRPDGLSPSCRSVLTNWRPSSPKSLTDLWSCSTINPVSNKSTITGLCDYRPIALMSQAHHRALAGPIQFAYQANGLASDAINMGQHHNMHPRPNQNQGRMPGSCSWTSAQLSRPSSQTSSIVSSPSSLCLSQSGRQAATVEAEEYHIQHTQNISGCLNHCFPQNKLH